MHVIFQTKAEKRVSQKKKKGREMSGSYLGFENEEGRIKEKKILPAVGRSEIGDRQ